MSTGDTLPPRRLTILGATGSIGASTADLVKQHPQAFAVEAVTANGKAVELAALARALGAKVAVVADPAAYADLKAALSGSGIMAAAGMDAVVEAASRPVDLTMAAIMGAAGLRATFAAAGAAQTLCLANKESLVCAGTLLTEAAMRHGTDLLPTDSEHNAIFQALGGRDASTAAEIILTASGGPFRTAPREALRQATPAQALRHPTWSMGAKITIDSATLVNKGLELIEAHYLFAVEPARLSVLVHPQSLVHGLVRFHDGSVMAQMGPPDMRVPIAHCLAWPRRITSGAQPLDLIAAGRLDFEAPDLERFPGLGLAQAAMAEGGAAPCILNAANEVAVAAFLEGRLGFLGIPELIERTLAHGRSGCLTRPASTLDDVLDIDREARLLASRLLALIDG